jgi:hypothetical protein
MKLLATVAPLLLCSAAAQASQVVEVIAVQASFQNPKITVSAGGKLQPGAKLEVFNSEYQRKLSLQADAQGVVTLPDLPAGQYYLTASTSPTLIGTICLQISAAHGTQLGAFSIALSPHPPPPPGFEDQLAAAEKRPVDLVTRSFSGAVLDPIGAVVPRASLAIYRQGAKDLAHPLKATADDGGQFYVQLKPGRYTVVVQSPGFKTQFVTIEISRDAPEKALNVKLNIGAVSETVAIAGASANH